MNFKSEYEFHVLNRKLDDDKELLALLNTDVFDNIRKWYKTYPDFDLVAKHADGSYDLIEILLNDIVFATKDRNLSDDLKNAVIIGNDGGDDLFLFVWNTAFKTGIYRIDDTLDVANMEYLATSLDSWLLE